MTDEVESDRLKYYIHYDFLVDLPAALMNRMASMELSLGLVGLSTSLGKAGGGYESARLPGEVKLI
jgi:hypothetical protein